MVKAEKGDRILVVNILTDSFQDNKSVNYVIKQDTNRLKRLKKLMQYSYDYCELFGEVLMSDDKNACALVIFPDKKKTTLKSVLLDIGLAWSCVGLSNLKKVLKRESKIRSQHGNAIMYYLWFIGVDSKSQNRGIGSSLLNELIHRSDQLHRPIYLETSTLKNLPWYEKFGFCIYHELDFGYKLFCLKR